MEVPSSANSKAVETASLLRWKGPIDAHLATLLPEAIGPLEKLHAAMRYSCLAPGKRIRPVLCMLAAEAINPSKVELALNPACALEMVHAFSLIHDDLPALDNDDLRRGRPTCHVQFGEATAILAGDALFALAFEAMSETPAAPHLIAQGIRILAQSAGSAGLVGGEIVDLESEGLEPTEDRLEFIHTRKTGALIRASCVLGALFAGGDDRALAELEAFGNEVGLAFQIADDILNETSTPEMLGKAAGSDRERQKATYPALYGLEASKAQARYLAERAVNRLGYLGPSAEHLAEVARFAVERLN